MRCTKRSRAAPAPAAERRPFSSKHFAASGEFLVTWHSYDQDGSLDGVFGQRFSPAGNRAAAEFQINTYTTDRQMLATVAADEAGRFVVAWRSWLQDGSTYGVYGRRVASRAFADGFESSDACA